MLVRALIALCVVLGAFSSHANEIRIALDADPISLDPHEQLSEGGVQYSHAVFDPLVRWRQDGTFEPRLATGWQYIDSNTLRISVRQGVTFHSGNTMTADDVLFTIDRLKRSIDFKALFNIVEDVDKIDAYTLDIHTKHPYPLLLNVLAYVFVIDEKFYQGHDEIIKFGETFASKNVSGTGPFMVSERIAGQTLGMVRNPHYWDQASNGNVERLELIPIRSDSTRLAALLTGDVDIISPVAPIDLERVKRTPDVDVFHMSGTRIVMLQMNELRRPEFKDVRVRRAMNLAINQSLIVEKILRGYGEAAGQLSAETFLGHVDAIQPEYDLVEAKVLMKAAGYEDGFRVSMMAPNNRYMGDEKVAQAAAAMLEKINIKVDLKTFPKAQYFQLYDQRAADIMMLGWQSDTFDSNNIYEFVLACADPKTGFGAYNASNYCNDVIDSDIRSANREMNPERRVRELRQIEMKAYEQAAVIPLFWQPIIWAARSNIELSSVVNFLNFPYWGDLYIE